MSAELPFDADVDRAALERRRAEDVRARRKHAARRELEVAELEANPPAGPGRTEYVRVPLSPAEKDRIAEAARMLRLKPATYLRRAGLALARQLGRLP